MSCPSVSPGPCAPFRFSIGLSLGLAIVLCCTGLQCAMESPDFLPPPPDSGNPPGDVIAREIEEADIVKAVDGFFYLANTFTGLRIIDAQAIDDPVMRGGVPLGGRGVELFIRDDLAFVFTTADFLRCAGQVVGFEDGRFEGLRAPDFDGSRLWIINIADKDAPTVMTQLDFDGFVSATRRVGDVIYVAGNVTLTPPPPDGQDDNGNANGNDNDNGPGDDNGNANGNDNDNGPGDENGNANGNENDNGPGDENGNDNANDNGNENGNDNANGNGNENGNENDNANENGNEDGGEGVQTGVFVTSINIADPENVFVVETRTFSGSALDIHTSTEALFVFGPDPDLVDTTLVSYVDISDPEGDILVRDRFRVPGVVENRFFVDDFEGVFRIVTEDFIESTFDSVVALYTYDLTDPDNITRLARTPIVTNESLRSVRFDGPRGFAVTFLRIDPLFVLDLADPADPKVTGSLQVPGFSTHLFPLGDRLLGVGFDDTNGVRPALALYDVSDASKPRQVSRVVLGDRGDFDTSSEATVDEKAIRVLDEAGLILMPFGTFDNETGEFVDFLQFVSMSKNELIQRGTIEHRGLVRRADLLDGRAWVLSDVAFQTVDVDDLDAPASVARVDILSDQDLLDAGLKDCADSARTRGTPLDAFFFNDFPFFDPFCGPLAPLLLLGILTGLVGMRYRRR